MLEEKGNLWTVDCDIRAITTNGFVKNNGACVMGRGCAKEAKDRFPGIEFLIGKLLKDAGNVPFYLIQENLLTFPVKHNWYEKADINLICNSAIHVLELAEFEEWNKIVIPRPGCGNGGLNWETEVKPVLSPILDDRFVIISF